MVDYYGRFLAPIPPKQRWKVNGFPSPRAMRLDRERRLADVRRTQERNRAKREAAENAAANATIAGIKTFCAAASGPLTFVRVVDS